MHLPTEHSPTVNPKSADTPFMHLWRECVWEAQGIGPTAKLILLRIGCFVDAKGLGCSISYRQLAANCDIDEKTARRVVAKLCDLWLDTKSRQGRLVPGKGRENLYHVMAPPSVVDKVLERKAAEADFDRAPCPVAPTGGASCPTNTVRTDNHLTSRTPPPTNKGVSNSKTPSGSRSLSNSNVIELGPYLNGGRS